MYLEINEIKDKVVMEFSYSFWNMILRELTLLNQTSTKEKKFHQLASLNSLLETIHEGCDIELVRKLSSDRFKENQERRKKLYAFQEESRVWIKSIQILMKAAFFQEEKIQEEAIKTIKEEFSSFQEKLGKTLYLKSISHNNTGEIN